MQRYSCFLTRGQDGHVDLTLAGDIDFSATAELTRIVHELAADRPALVEVHLEMVSFFAAAGVNFLVALRTLAEQGHATVTVSGMPFEVSRLLDLCELADILPDGPMAPAVERRRRQTDLRGPNP